MEAPGGPSSAPKVAPARPPPTQLVLENVTPATRLLEKRRQMFEVQEALEQQKQDYTRKEEMFRRREEALKKKDLELQESLLRFTKFLQENDAKRAKANKRGADEVRLREEKEREIAALGAEREALKAEREGVARQLQRMIKYQHYLQSVVESGDSFHEIEDILTRHATLEVASKDLQEQQAECTRQAELIRAETAEYVRAHSNEALDLNNRLSLLKKRLQLLQQEAAALEAKQDYSLQVAAQKTLEYGQICMSTNNLYQRCLLKSKVAHAAEERNPVAQLEAVGHFTSDLREAIKRRTAQLQQQQNPAAVSEQQQACSGGSTVCCSV